jgi:hypothetical protein
MLSGVQEFVHAVILTGDEAKFQSMTPAQYTGHMETVKTDMKSYSQDIREEFLELLTAVGQQTATILVSCLNKSTAQKKR